MLRPSVLLLAIALMVSGCGISARTPAAPVTITAAAPTAPRIKPVLPPPPVDPLVVEPGQTVVSLTFDDGLASTTRAAQIMNAYGLRGTFFVNSGTIGKPGFLSLSDLDWIATNSGNEIGGHTVHHYKLNTLDQAQAQHEICDDRAALMDKGFPVRSFAYPFAVDTPEARQIAADCGYNSARSLGELRSVHVPENATPETNCSLCDWAETVPPIDPSYTRAPAEVTNRWVSTDFQQQIAAAQDVGGGWVQITFHGICPTTCTELSVSESVFTEFIVWLADQQAQGLLIVRTVGEVIGGEVRPRPEVSP